MISRIIYYLKTIFNSYFLSKKEGNNIFTGNGRFSAKVWLQSENDECAK